jgi:DNA-binding transcriptional ArsR family regulator
VRPLVVTITATHPTRKGRQPVLDQVRPHTQSLSTATALTADVRQPSRCPGSRAPGATKAGVLAALKDGNAMTAGEIAAATGLGRATVSTTLSRLAASGEIAKAARGYQIRQSDAPVIDSAGETRHCDGAGARVERCRWRWGSDDPGHGTVVMFGALGARQSAVSVALRAHRVLRGGDYALKLPGEIGGLLVKSTQVPFGGVQLGAGLGERVAHLDGSAARRLDEAHRPQHQHKRTRDGRGAWPSGACSWSLSARSGPAMCAACQCVAPTILAPRHPRPSAPARA